MLLWIQAQWIKLAAAAIILALVFFLGWTIGSGKKQHAWDEATAKAYRKAAEEAETLATQAAETERIANEKLATVVADRDAAIASLRNRPDRVPRPAAVTCEGSTGRELSKPDAEFLTRLAADADRQAVTLAACYEREDEYRKAMIGNSK